MIIDAIFVAFVFYFTFPLLSGYVAYQYGRSFKIWFFIGCFLPIISFILLVAIIVWNEKTTPRHQLSRREQMESKHLVEDLKKELFNTAHKAQPHNKDLPSGWHF